MIYLVGDQCRRAQGRKVVVTVLDNFDPGEHLAHRIGNVLDPIDTRRQIAGQAHGDFALHTRFNEDIETKIGGTAIDVTGFHEPRRRAAQAEVFLHPLAGRADLEPGGGRRPDQPGQRDLGQCAFRHRGWRPRERQHRPAIPPRPVQRGGGESGIEHQGRANS